MARLKFKTGDRVHVMTGRDKGKSGEITRMFPKENRAIVRGVNMVRRHLKQTPQQEGGIVSKEAPIQISNLAVEDPKDGKPTRVGFKFIDAEQAGDKPKKVRFAKRSGEIIPEKE